MTKILQHVFVVLALGIAVSESQADNLNDLFGGGILDTTWGMSVSEVQSIYPDGETPEAIGKTYSVKNEKTILKQERKKKHRLDFQFDTAGRLYAIRIQFSDSTFIKLNEVLEGLLGKVDYEPMKTDIIAGMNVKTWSNNEITVKSFVAMSGLFSSSTFLEVAKIPSSAPSKDELGL